jgi:hypothetical protein
VLGQDQSLPGSKPQTWIDKLNHIKTEFTYLPASPAIDKPTQLKFDVVHLQNGTKLGNLSARVIVLTTSSGQERSFVFPNVVSQNGSFSVKYLFPEFGSYQVISRIDSKGFSALSSFSVFVPIGDGGSISTSTLLAAVVVGIIGIIVFVVLGPKKKKRRRIAY